LTGDCSSSCDEVRGEVKRFAVGDEKGGKHTRLYAADCWSFCYEETGENGGKCTWLDAAGAPVMRELERK